MTKRGRKYAPAEVRFYQRVDALPGHGPNGDCWLWTGTIVHNGYGQMVADGSKVYVHRFAYELAHGIKLGTARTSGPLVLHSCDTRNCVNPEHLFLGDDIVNVRDMIRKGRKESASQKGEANNSAKLTPEQVLLIRADRRAYWRIELEYGVAQSTISQIKTRVLWPHL